MPLPAVSVCQGPPDDAFSVRAATDNEGGPEQQSNRSTDSASHQWNWRRASAAEFAGISIGVAGTLYSEAAYGEPSRPGWTAHNGFDQGIRSALRLRSNVARNAAGNLGDVLMGLLIAEPVIDSFATLGYRDHHWDALVQTSVINLESFTFTALIASAMENSIRRQKPYLQSCPSCANDESNRSMPSGHTAFAFTGAGLFCTNHAYQSLYRNPELERTLCITSVALAATDGVARIMADQHYATDVIAGSAIGIFSGFLLPRLLHYWWPEKEEGKNSDPVYAGFSPQVLEGGIGLKWHTFF